jgi:DnaJ domain
VSTSDRFYDRFYEALGVRPGASRQELKIAYRDLTKVWHPDRFAHDPRLQQKAEEKLREINEAYDQLISLKMWRPRITHSRGSSRRVARQSNSYSSVAPTKSRSVIWLLAPLFVFGAVFAFTIRFLHARANRDSQTLIERSAAQSDAPTRDETSPPALQSARKSEASASSRQTIEQQQVPTTTVTIDSTTGLLARDECPTRITMTYPTGSEPHAYCNSHSASQSTSNPHQQSRLKSLRKNSASSNDDSEKQPQEP